MTKRRVVVTGMGMISPLGVGNQPTWEGLIAGRSGIGPITKFDAAQFSTRIAGEVKGFNPEQWIEKKDVKKSDTFIHYAIAEADIVFAGGSEAVITPLAVGGFGAMRALSTRNDEPERASRPWDADRDGFVMGEGAGVLILETIEHATARGARIYCEVTGYGMS